MNKTVSEHKGDHAGRDRLMRNAFVSWGSYLIIVIAGFIMPRLMDIYVGQQLLGIWDFSWAFVNYLTMAGLGLGSSVGRYVARYNSKGEKEKLNTLISTVFTLQLLVTLFVVVVTIIFSLIVPEYILASNDQDAKIAQKVVLFLGFSFAIQMFFDTSRGVLTGCHRWDIYNGLQAASRILITIGMIVVLVSGGSLVELSLVYLVFTVLFESTRAIIALKILPGISRSPKCFSMSYAKKTFQFGIKSIMVAAPGIVTIQTINIMVVASLGPEALAVLARPIALIKHLETFIHKFTFILVPTAGSLQGAGEDDALREFFLTVAKFTFAMTIPAICLLVVFGDHIIELWMGDKYVNWALMMILPIGYLLPISQSAVTSILVGMNKHGIVGGGGLIITIVSLVIGIVIIDSFGWTLERAAILTIIPSLLIHLFLVPSIACKAFKIGVFEYVSRSVFLPIIIGVVYAALLSGARLYLLDDLIVAVLVCIISTVLLVVVYWRYILNSENRSYVLNVVRKKKG